MFCIVLYSVQSALQYIATYFIFDKNYRKDIFKSFLVYKVHYNVYLWIFVKNKTLYNTLLCTLYRIKYVNMHVYCFYLNLVIENYMLIKIIEFRLTKIWCWKSLYGIKHMTIYIDEVYWYFLYLKLMLQTFNTI